MPQTRQLRNSRGSEGSEWAIWLTRIALLLVLALVVARATVSETLRDPFEVRPGTQAVPRGLGAAGGAVLDLLACLPALLVLVRAAIDRRFTITFTKAHALMFALAAWIALSTIWAPDRFATAVEATHWVAAMVLLWTVSQLVRSWSRMRLVAAVCFGLLLVLTAHGLIYRFVDVPDQRESFLKNQDQIFADRGWTADSFIAQQFKRKVMSGEIIGFSSSPNTYAMMLVLLGGVTLGLIVQRVANRDETGWAIVMGLCFAPALLVLWLTKCRAALATPVVEGGLLLGVGVVRRVCARKSGSSPDGSDTGVGGEMGRCAYTAAAHRRVYWAAVASVLLGVAALVGHGLYHGSLIHESLTFRWRYWVGSMRVFVQHPLLGVGFGNFGQFYLAVRMPIASEEIKDPHNLFVRIAVETGIIGAFLIIAWMMRLWWELTRPGMVVENPLTVREKRPPYLAVLGAIAGLAIFINTLASVDFTQSSAFVLIEVLKRVLWMALLFGGTLVGCMRSMQRQEIDNRTAPWLVWAVLAALAAFLLHNMIEFGLFEPGPLLTFALLVGAVLGIRGERRQRTGGWWIAGAAMLCWFVVVVVWVVPLAIAEGRVQAGDDALQAGRADAAVALYADAFNGLPLANADYAMKEGVGRMFAHAPAADVKHWLDVALAADPTLIRGYLTRARFELQSPTPDQAAVRWDFAKAIALNPNDVEVRLDYAAALEGFGLKREAAEEYRAALEKNEGLSWDEPKRLSKGKVEEVKGRIAGLER